MIRVTLWENAYDSLQHGLVHLERAEKTEELSLAIFDYKRAVMDFCHAAELLLKEMLFRIDPIYAFDKNQLFEKCNDPLNPTMEELYNCKSLEVNPLCRAIQRYVPKFTGNTKIYSNQAAKLRNKIQHFCFEVRRKEIREILLRLSHQLLTPAFYYLKTAKDYRPIDKRLRKIFTIGMDVEQYLNNIDSEYESGVCYSCGTYSFYIEYNGLSYPEHCFCTSCNYGKYNIKGEIYYECPECNIGSLLFCEELDSGVCLNYKCANQKDGGIVTPMEWCDNCREYKIEELCNCEKKIETN